MKSLLNDRVTFVWLILAALTAVSLLLADGAQPQTLNGMVYLSLGLLALAMFKVRLVIMHFMEVLHAPWLLRGIFEVWVVAVFIAMCVFYLQGLPN